MRKKASIQDALFIIMAETKTLVIWQKSDASLEQMQMRGSMPEIVNYEFLLERDGYQLLLLERHFSALHSLVLAYPFPFFKPAKLFRFCYL